MRGLAHDPAEVDAACLLRLEWIADVELQELAGTPRRNVEPAVVEGEIDVGHERRHGLEALEQRRQNIGIRGLGRDVDDLLDLVARTVEVPRPD